MEALHGIRVLDLTRLLMGGYLTQALADLGAEVIKIEEPRAGDPGRHQLPRVRHESYYHLILDRNKQSVRLNLKDPAGVAALQRLVAGADVLVENFRPGVMARLGLDYDRLAAINPRLIYCSLSAFGQDGPRRAQAAHDLNLQALAGHVALAAPRGGQPPPPPVLAADLGTALWGAVAILAAVVERGRSGRGQYVDVSMFDVSLSLLSIYAGRSFALADPERRRPSGDLTGLAPRYNVYATADGHHMALAAWEDYFWARFCAAVGRPDLADPPADPADEAQKVAELRRLFATRTRREWEELAASGDFCLTPAQDVAEALQDPQARHRQMVFTLDHPTEGPIQQLACPVRLSRTPPTYRTPPPALGADTERVLGTGAGGGPGAGSERVLGAGTDRVPGAGTDRTPGCENAE